MWLMSQDGETLINANCIWVNKYKIYAEHNSTDEDTFFTMGIFESNAEAKLALAEVAKAISCGFGFYQVKKNYRDVSSQGNK